MSTIHPVHEIFIILLIAVPLVLLAFIGSDKLTNPLIATESPKEISLEQRMEQADSDSFSRDFQAEWNVQLDGFNTALQNWQASLNVMNTVKDSYGVIAVSGLFIDVYEQVHSEGKKSIAFLERFEEQFVLADINSVVLEGQIRQHVLNADEFLGTLELDLLQTKQELFVEKSKPDSNAQSIDLRIRQIDDILWRLKDRPRLE